WTRCSCQCGRSRSTKEGRARDPLIFGFSYQLSGTVASSQLPVASKTQNADPSTRTPFATLCRASLGMTLLMEVVKCRPTPTPKIAKAPLFGDPGRPAPPADVLGLDRFKQTSTFSVDIFRLARGSARAR